jgi:toxin HigB-1
MKRRSQVSSIDAVKRNRGCVRLRLSSIPLRYIEATCYLLDQGLHNISVIKIACRALSDIIIIMIKSFKHKGLQDFYEKGNSSGIQAQHRQKIRMQLVALDTATIIDDIDLPGFRLHPLKGNMKGLWSIEVNKNWRITFEFKAGDVYIVNYEDYH